MRFRKDPCCEQVPGLESGEVAGGVEKVSGEGLEIGDCLVRGQTLLQLPSTTSTTPAEDQASALTLSGANGDTPTTRSPSVTTGISLCTRSLAADVCHLGSSEFDRHS